MKRKKTGKLEDLDTLLKRTLPAKSLKQVNERAQKEVMSIQLAQLRKEANVTQSEVKGFSQVDVSKLEGRKDLKLSTLIKYATALGAEIEIKAHFKKRGKEITLLRAS